MKKKKKTRIEIVFHLIKKMSQSDKRYFKLNNQGYNKNKDFLKLFDCLNAQKVLDASAIEELFPNKNISPAINYLHNRVTGVLEEKAKEAFSITKLYDKDIEQHLNVCYVYLYAELSEDALKEIDKAEKVALKKNNYFYLIKIYRTYQKILNRTHRGRYEYDKLLKKFSEKLAWAIKEFKLINEIAANVLIIAMSPNQNTLEYKKAAQNIEAYNANEEGLSFYLKYCILTAKTNHCYRKKEYEKTAVLLNQMILSWESVPYTEWDIGVYLGEWRNLLFLSVDPNVLNSKTDYFKRYLDLPQKHPTVFEIAEQISLTHYRVIKYSMGATIIVMRREYDKIYKLEQELLKEKSTLLNSFNFKSQIQEIFLHIVLTYLTLENHKRANYWLEKYDNFFDVGTPWDSTYEILIIMMHYDKRNFIYLESKIRNLNRKWQKEQPQNSNPHLLLKIMQKVLLKSNRSKAAEIWKVGLEELYEVEKIQVRDFIRLSRWVETKI